MIAQVCNSSVVTHPCNRCVHTRVTVHVANSLFEQDDTEAILLVDAKNAFNSLNRLSALQNIRSLCPSLATILINSYRAPTELFIDGDVVLSREGTTQGDPLAMPFYAIATIPIIKQLRSAFDDISQVWYADDASAAGKIDALRQWWDLLSSPGPKFGYFPNASKTWLVVKSQNLASAASTTFADTGVQVTSVGRPYLGAAIGTRDFVHSYIESKVSAWVDELDCLATIAKSQPHAAHSAFTHGFSNKWSYLSRTIPDISPLLQPLEFQIRSKLIPSLTGQPPP